MTHYRKIQYTHAPDGRPAQVTIRNYDHSDFSALIDVQRECYPPPFPAELWWNEEQLANHVELFPAGALCAEVGGKLVGSMTALIVQMDAAEQQHSWSEVTDEGYIRTHNPNGNTLYIVDISVRPSARKLGIGKLLMQSMYELVIHHNLDRLLGGGRMSGYHKEAHRMTAQAYLYAVLRGDCSDPVISFLLRCGRVPIGVSENYLEDEESCNYAALMEWRNPFKTIRE